MCRNCATDRPTENHTQPAPIVGQYTFGAEFSGIAPIVPILMDRFNCAACNEETKGEDRKVGTDDASYCEDCFSDDFVECSDCGNAVDRGDEKTSDSGDGYCEECYNETFSHCESCNGECYSDDMHVVNDCECICESCYDRDYSTCAGRRCHATVCNDNAHEVDGNYYCDDCYCENFTVCECCDETIACEYSHFCERFDETYCESCYPGDECDCEGCEDGCNCEPPRSRNNRPTGGSAPSGAKYWSNAQFAPAENSTVRTGTTRTFAIEVETATCPGHADFAGKYAFNCESDGSIGGEEFPSAVLSGDAGLDAITAFLDAANSAGWAVDSRCGTHAHFGVRDLSVDQLKSLAYAYLLTSDAWRSFVSKSRRDNHFCQPVKWGLADLMALETSADFMKFAKDQGDACRYQWINWGAYAKSKNGSGPRKTVECRLHAGSTDPVKLNNWVVCHLKFIEAVSNMPLAMVERKFAGKTGYEQFMALASIWDDKAMSDYMAARAAKFGTNYTTSTRASIRRFVKA